MVGWSVILDAALEASWDFQSVANLVEFDPELAAKAEAISTALGDFYQAVGRAAMADS